MHTVLHQSDDRKQRKRRSLAGFKIDSIATVYNKKLVIGECWLHKADDADLSTLPPHVIFSRDAFGFWIPLDSLFTECIVSLSHLTKSELTSLIWATFLFSYLDYLPEHDTMPLDKLYNLGYTASIDNLFSKTFSRTGSLYHNRIREACYSTSIPEKRHKTESLDFKLKPNYPNPFNSETLIKYQIIKNGRVQLQVFNMQGQFIQTLVDAYQVAGNYSVTWNSRDSMGHSVSSGIYLLKCVLPEHVKIQKMVMVQ